MRRPSVPAAAAAIAVSAVILRSRRLQVLDRRAGLALARPLGPVGDAVFGAGTDLGSVFAIAGASTALAATGRLRLASDVLAAGAGGWITAQAVKPLVNRPRPYHADGVTRIVSEPAGASWPSGHVAVAAAMATATAPWLSRRGRAGAVVMTAFVAVSRVYVGVHYASDVVAGLGLGVLTAHAWRGMRRMAEVLVTKSGRRRPARPRR